MFKKLWELIISPYTNYKNKKQKEKEEQEYEERMKKRLEELRKQDPFIYD